MNKDIAKQQPWHQKAAVVAGVSSILLAAGLCGGSSGSISIFLWIEGVTIIFLGVGILLLRNPEFIPPRMRLVMQQLWRVTKPLFRYVPGLVLMSWTLLPILPIDINKYLQVQAIPEEAPYLYLLFTPIMWIMIGIGGAYNTKLTVAFGLISHVALFIAALQFINSSPLSFFIDWDILFRLGLLALIIFAAIASTILLSVTGWLIRRDARKQLIAKDNEV